MEIAEIIVIVLVVICAIIYGLMLYFRVKGNLTGAVSEFIALAEQSGYTNPEKMALVVDSMFEMVPKFLRKVLNKSCLEKIAQKIYDWMKRFHEERSANTIAPETVSETISVDAAAIYISELLGITLGALQEKGIDLGISSDCLKTKKQCIEAIVRHVLSKT